LVVLWREEERVVSKRKREKRKYAPETKPVSGGLSRVDALHKQELFLLSRVQADEHHPLMEVLRRHGLLLVATGGVPILVF